jgi:hypothetical protein
VGLVGTVVAAGFVCTLPDRDRGEEPWRIQWPRVGADIRADFLRLGVTAGVVWAALALYLSVVPSFVAELLSTDDLAVLGANSALACFASAFAQVWTRKHGGHGRRAQAAGLGLLGSGLVLLIVSSVTHSLVTVLLGALLTGLGHGQAYLHAQDELNRTVPGQRRAEVSAAFVCCIYVWVGGSVISIGLLDELGDLTTGVCLVGGVLTLASIATAGWQNARARFG